MLICGFSAIKLKTVLKAVAKDVAAAQVRAVAVVDLVAVMILVRAVVASAVKKMSLIIK